MKIMKERSCMFFPLPRYVRSRTASVNELKIFFWHWRIIIIGKKDYRHG